MIITQHIAELLRHVYFGGNWTAVNFKDTIADVNWKQASTRIDSLNTIATLIYHTNYYVAAVTNVLKAEPLAAHDKDSFNMPPVESEENWQALLNKTWRDAEEIALLIEQFPEARLFEVFVKDKYGTYYRNFHGLIEHSHYHLGQIVLVKKLLQSSNQ